ncbi:MAG: hypothetical protein OXP73_09080 [Chloroflexota bacterium]|nr:hypothetical protein [Chloroflexota bacterium]
MPLRSAAAYWELQRTALSRVESAIARHQAGRIDEAAGLFFEAAVDFSDAQFEFGQAARRTGKPWARGLHAANGTLSDLMYRIGAALRLGNPIAHIVDEANPVLDQLEDHLSQMMGDLGS